MRETVRQLASNRNPRYFNLVELTLLELVKEEPELMIHEERVQDALIRLADRSLGVLIVEAYQYLLTFGYIVPEPQGNRIPNWDGVRITESGRLWAEGSEPVPEDQGGFLATLKANVPRLDPVVLQYAQESVAAYNRRMFFASAVMIGAASEKTMYLLAYAIKDALKDQKEQKSIEKLLDERKMGKLLSWISEKVAHAKKVGMPYAVHEGADKHLIALMESVRVQRNDAVHPEAGKVQPEAVRLTLSAFPGSCKKIYDLIDWFQKNQI
jgi:hypothetical protein